MKNQKQSEANENLETIRSKWKIRNKEKLEANGKLGANEKLEANGNQN